METPSAMWSALPGQPPDTIDVARLIQDKIKGIFCRITLHADWNF
jgi:hypothetical protein